MSQYWKDMGSLAEQLRPIATDLSAAPRVYVDANLPAGVVAMMRSELGWDVLFVLEDDRLRRAPDEEHFRLALEFGRTLITLDYDFCDDRRFPMASSPGVIVCSAPDEAALMRLLRHADRSLLRVAPAAGLPLRGQKVELTPGVFSSSARGSREDSESAMVRHAHHRPEQSRGASAGARASAGGAPRAPKKD